MTEPAAKQALTKRSEMERWQPAKIGAAAEQNRSKVKPLYKNNMAVLEPGAA